MHASALVVAGTARFTVHGTKGTLIKAELDPQEDQLRAGMLPTDSRFGIDDDPIVLLRPGEPPQEQPAPRGDHLQLYRGFGDAVRGEGDNPVPPAQAVALMTLLEAGIESARAGRSVELDWDAAARSAFGLVPPSEQPPLGEAS